MRKLFFVKKNVNEPTEASNWIEMNVDEFNKFISTEEGKARKNNFAPLFGFGAGDADYYIETTREEVSKIRKENNRHAYLKRLEKESGCVTVSLNELDLYGENEQEDRIVDPTAFVDKIYIAKETSAEIQKALSMLTDKQRDINRTKTIYNTSIYSPEWAEIDNYNHRRLYAILGFRTLGDFLGMRVYDFLNMNQNDSGYAGNTILDLYNFVNPNNEIDEAIYYDAIEQPINTRRWIAERGSAENITIEEIIFDPLMNKEALNNIFNSICRVFYKSSEYSIRQYKYAYLRDVPKNKRVPHEQK